MKEPKNNTLKVRLDNNYLDMLEYLTDKFQTNKSNLIRTLILIAYDKETTNKD